VANTKSAIKQMRVSERKRLRNKPIRSRAKTEVKKTRLLIAAGDLEAAQVQAQVAIRALDRAASKGVIHHNNADRRKSRLMKRLNQALAEAGAE
jgi:small subunit ribosomal protein S20